MENLKEIIENLETSVVIDLWNRYCDENRYYEDRIEYMEDLDDYLYDLKPTEIIDRCKDVYTGNDYFKDGIYGIESFDEISLFDYIYLDDLVRYIENNPDDFYDVEEIEEFFEESEENT